ncbi:hypothetical protein HK102_013825 [Quaeritorhiza haematococci]|nr:hypothetical protein HK102_013825 [Quaeritorhiza haematococci]
MDRMKTDGTNVFVQVPYSTAQRLVADCLKRMVDGGKIISKKSTELRLIIDLYSCKDVASEPEPDLPAPAPAPSVPDLWLLLCRPEYFCWTFYKDLGECSRDGLTPSLEVLNQQLDLV